MVVEKKTDEKKENVQKTQSTTCDETTPCSCESERNEQAGRIIRNHMLTSMGVGLLPLPVVDLVAITGVQLNMLRRLSNTYEVPFTEHKVKNILTSLVGGGAVIPIGEALISLVKTIPLVGPAIGAVTMPITAGAVTYAVGKVFLQHFASGGTFLTFDPEKVRDYYAQMFEEGKEVAAKAKASVSAAP